MSFEEKSNANVEVDTADSSDQAPHHVELKKHTQEEIAASGKWYDRKLVSFLPQYSNATIQVVMLAFVVFMLPGMYNALSGIGVAIDNPTVNENANTALYCTFAGVGFFAGSIVNTFGPRACLALGGTGYVIYAGSLLSFQHNRNEGFVIFAGAYLGLCAGCLWAAQSTMIMSYPVENRKGRAIMIFWVIFNLGAVIGSIVPLASNMNNTGSSATDGTFIAFMILMCVGVVLAFSLLPMNKVYKEDGTKVMTKKNMKWKEEVFGVFILIWKKPIILLLFPMFFASNWFYTYQFNDFNAGRFNLRTRSLNSLLYWLSQMVGAGVFGFILDFPKLSRPMRAKVCWAILFVLGLAIWGAGLKFQLGFTRESVVDMEPIDFTHGNYGGPVVLYIFYGIYDAVFQTYIFWALGCLSNNPKTTALYGGMYKGIQSAGAAVAWRCDALNTSYMGMFGSSWGLCNGSLLIAIPLIFFKITETTDVVEDNILAIMGDEEIKGDSKTEEHV